MVECIEDLWSKIYHFFWEKDETRKVCIKLSEPLNVVMATASNCICKSFLVQVATEKQFVESYLPLTLSKLEKAVALNKAPEGWIIGNKVSSLYHITHTEVLL